MAGTNGLLPNKEAMQEPSDNSAHSTSICKETAGLYALPEEAGWENWGVNYWEIKMVSYPISDCSMWLCIVL